MSWIESHQSLARHRKTLALVALLKVDRHKLIGHLQELWWWGLDNADSSGLVGQVASESLAQAAGWRVYDAEHFVQALVTVGFVDVVEDGYVLHDWYEYAGKLNDQREKNRERMRSARAAHKDRTNGTRVQEHADTSGARAPATGPDQPDRSTTPSPGRELNPAGPARQPARTREARLSPELLAEHQRHLDQERASRAMPSQPIENSLIETTGDGHAHGR
jgi:hypothetical protein